MSSLIRIEHFAELDSTNEEARRRVMAGERGPLWLRADVQTAGRGRRGRAWVSQSGNLFATGLFVLNAAPREAAQLSFATALSAAAVADAAIDPTRVKLKWPNDVLADGRKLAGLLLESGDAPGGGLWLAVGVGINLAHHPEESERPTTDLTALGGEVTPERAVSILADAFEHWRARWSREGFAPIREAWLARAHGLGERCEVRLQDETLSGVFADLGPDGALRLDLPGGDRRFISAGDVFFPSAP
ncbi:MAG: biotin--[acetyl-CoA-carboxylase] ligase [Pseudomonadota bacterium]